MEFPFDAKSAFQALLSVVGYMVMKAAAQISRDLHRVAESVEKLNINMATVLEKIEGHEKRIERLEGQKE